MFGVIRRAVAGYALDAPIIQEAKAAAAAPKQNPMRFRPPRRR